MSAHAPESTAARGSPDTTDEICLLCGSPLYPDQEWCLGCGSAARTRLASTPNWRAPVIAVAILVLLALGVLTAALVKLAG